MSDTSAQPTDGLARRFVGDANSTIGSMIKRGFTGGSTVAAPSAPVAAAPLPADNALASPPPPALESVTYSQPSISPLDVLEEAIEEAKKVAPASPVVSPTETVSPVSPPVPPDPVAEGVFTQAMPQAVADAAQAVDLLQQAGATSRKEAGESVSLDQIAADAARGVQVVETEPSPEISPEVESYLQKVEENKDMAPPEIVIADTTQALPANRQFPSQPVIVLPITPEAEQAGVKKGPQFSIRWLVEWSRRLMKAFAGKIIYRPIEGSTAS